MIKVCIEILLLLRVAEPLIFANLCKQSVKVSTVQLLW